MTKIVKIPLVMKNGEKATDMKSLIANFDAESVIGYFFDGKLEKWLNDRYYEDEAEAVAQLNKDDPALAKKLCEIFGVKYEATTAINAGEIAWRNERIARLKQITDDEEAIRNVDAVAFNQEELANLYDRDVAKIYLCEGCFQIPKSKKELTYVFIGDVEASGIEQETRPEPDDEIELKISNLIVTEFLKQQGIDISNDRGAMKRIYQEAKVVKETLLRSLLAPVDLPNLAMTAKGSVDLHFWLGHSDIYGSMLNFKWQHTDTETDDPELLELIKMEEDMKDIQ